MVNNLRSVTDTSTGTPLRAAAVVVRVYLVLVIVTVVALAILSFAGPFEATPDAWGHAIVVAVFAVVLPLRLRAAQTGRRGAVRVLGLISALLLVVNLAEALVPGFVPTWMRAQMWVVTALMLVVVLDVVRWAVTDKG